MKRVHPPFDVLTRLGPGDEAPSRLWEGGNYLYLCVFSFCVKIGVSTSPHARRLRHEKAAGERVHEMYLLRLWGGDAYERELMIAHAFGEKEPRRGRHSEWFPLNRRADCLHLMVTGPAWQAAA